MYNKQNSIAKKIKRENRKEIKEKEKNRKKNKKNGAGTTEGRSPSVGPANYHPRPAHLARGVVSLLLFPRHSCCRAHRGARRRSAARWLPPRRYRGRLALKYPLTHPVATARSISSHLHLVIVSAKSRRHCRRHGRKLPRPLSSPASTNVSVGAAADALVAAPKELGREPLHRAQHRRSFVLLRRSSSSNSSPSRRPRA